MDIATVRLQREEFNEMIANFNNQHKPRLEIGDDISKTIWEATSGIP